ncbi:TOBE domain-containing protein [Primorskyibacter sedentarius]|uniref:TOBE domain-containing protein n=1 Tax=Primorskyibacter sedentarius TaxID=745311 RepID=UPI001048E748|nr:TOBE domain-containing protein [Primorskyibacter sedentarius]
MQQSLTHDQIEAMTLADRIVVLRDGHIEQVGTPLELYDNPANAFVGTFLGSPSMSLFAANVMPNDPMRLRLPDGDEIRLPHPANRQGAVSMGIRPESFRLVEAGAENALAADVVVVEPTGSMTEIVLRKGGLDFVATFPERVDLRPGQPVHLSVASKDVRIFEAEAAARPAP